MLNSTSNIHLPYNYILYHYKNLHSTNSEAIELAERGTADGTVILADKQTSGRGRNERVWDSPLGNLYFSIIVRDKEFSSKMAQLSFIAAVAIGETLQEIFNQSSNNKSEINIQYKWPNDVLVNGKKIAGILLESRATNSQPADWVIIGMGVNIYSAPPYATTISQIDSNCKLSNLQLLEKIIKNFDILKRNWLHNGFAQIRDMWLTKAYNLGKQISIKIHDSTHYGVFIGIDSNGKIILKQEDNYLYFDSGEVFSSVDNRIITT